MARGTANIRHRASLQAISWMSKSSVRLALVTSVACTRPPVSRQIRNESTVPNRTSPRSHRSRSPGIVSRRCTIFVPEKYGSSSSPVRRRTSSSSPAASIRAQIGADTLLCQTTAGATGAPVARSQRIVVSRWLVTPTAATCAGSAPALRSTARAQDNCDRQMSSGSCSTIPSSVPSGPRAVRACWGNSSWATATTEPRASKRIARLEVVP